MQRYFAQKLEENEVTLSNDDLFHINRVMRMKTGDKIEVVYNHDLYICEVGEGNITNPVFHEKGNNDRQMVIIIPLLKEQKMDYILQKATELGATEIIPVEMERSVVKLDASKEEKKIERWTKICKEASEQSKRTNIPVVTKVKKLKELAEIDGLKVICSTKEKEKTIKNFLTDNKNYDKINIVMGPEGGIAPREEELLVTLGFTPVTLGSRILRIETVPLYVLSVINYELMN